VVAGLSVVAAYFLACFHVAMAGSPPVWSTFGNWQMFTVGSRTAGEVDADELIGGEWQPVDLLGLFPSQWDSGPRFGMAFRKNGQRMRVLGVAICGRDPGHPEKVRLYDVSWAVKVGERRQRPENAPRKLVVEVTCGDHVPLPAGRIL
jgi:hypothetical protein